MRIKYNRTGKAHSTVLAYNKLEIASNHVYS